MLSGTVILFDVDNTLFDNDGFKDALGARLLESFGPERSRIYWKHYEALRDALGYVDYLQALQRMRLEIGADPRLPEVASFLLDYPFAAGRYPDALEAIAHLSSFGTTAIFSDGDIVFQPRKIQHAGLWDAVDGRVEIAIHKQRSLDAMRARFPAAHYVMVDDKPGLLAQMKASMGPMLTCVFVRQGHYAVEALGKMPEPPPDRTVERIGELCTIGADWLFPQRAPARR